MRKLAGTIAALSAANQASQIAATPAKNVIGQAQGQLVEDQGVLAYLKPQMWYLMLLKLSLSQPMLIFAVGIVAVVLIGAWLFGLVSLYYWLYYMKAHLAIIFNVFLSIFNAIWFAFNAITSLLTYAFFDLVNLIIGFFVEPIINGLNFVLGFLGFGPIEMKTLGEGMKISIQPTHAFTYWVPASVVGPNAFGFISVHAGADIYVVNEAGELQVDEVYDQNGAKLLMPRIDPKAEARDKGGSYNWWDTLYDRPPDVPYAAARTFNIFVWQGKTILYALGKSWNPIDWAKSLFGGGTAKAWVTLFADVNENIIRYLSLDRDPPDKNIAWMHYEKQIKNRIGYARYIIDAPGGKFGLLDNGWYTEAFEPYFWKMRVTHSWRYAGQNWKDLNRNEAFDVIEDYLKDPIQYSEWHPDYR